MPPPVCWIKRRHAQGAEDAVAVLAHVIFDRQHKTGGQLAQRRARAGKGGAVGEEATLGQQIVKRVRRRRRIAAMLVFHLGDVIGNAVEHAGRRLQQRAVIIAPQIALLQHLDAVLTQVDRSIAHIVGTGEVDALTLDVFDDRVHRFGTGKSRLLRRRREMLSSFGHALSPIQHDKYGYHVPASEAAA